MWFWMMESNNIYLWLLQLSLMSLCPPCPCISRTASPSHLSPRPPLDVPKSLVLRPHVPGPHTRVSMSPSPCPCPSFIHSHKFVVIQQMHDSFIIKSVSHLQKLRELVVRMPNATYWSFCICSHVKWFRLEVNFRGIFDNSLHRHLNKLVKRIQLLSNEALLVKIRTDDDPAGLLPQIPSYFLSLILPISNIYDKCKKLRWNCVRWQNCFCRSIKTTLSETRFLPSSGSYMATK